MPMGAVRAKLALPAQRFDLSWSAADGTCAAGRSRDSTRLTNDCAAGSVGQIAANTNVAEPKRNDCV
jgi:hypothetical protein